MRRDGDFLCYNSCMENIIQEYKIEAVYIAKEINLAKTAEKLDKNLIGRRREFLIFLFGG